MKHHARAHITRVHMHAYTRNYPTPVAWVPWQEVKQERPAESKWGPPPPGAPAAAYSGSAPFAEPPQQSYAPPPYAGQPQVMTSRL